MRIADEAFALNGARAAETYLDIPKLLDVARRSGADAVHPGYGFLAENAAFAQAVLDAGLVWIGPPPSAIESLGDKVSARHIAQQGRRAPGRRHRRPRAGRRRDPRVRRRARPARRHQGGVRRRRSRPEGRRASPARSTRCSSPPRARPSRRSVAASASSSATSTARGTSRRSASPTPTARWSSSPRVTARCSAATRSWSRRRPRRSSPTRSARSSSSPSKAILREAGYVGAGTCEFLVAADGTISFLEVNTRLQVEHPVTEEISGIDLVREQLRIAAGEPLGYDHVETARPLASSSGSTARTRARASCRRRAASRRCASPPAPACASTPAWSRATASPACSTR